MASMEDRARLIRESMLKQAEREAADIRAEADAFHKSEMASLEDEVLARMHGKITSEVAAIKGNSLRQAAQYELDLRKEALARREELSLKVFASVRGKLLDYVSGEGYRKALLAQLRELADKFAGSSVGLREPDLDLADEISEILGSDARIKADPSIRIGGFTLTNRESRLFYDGTLDTKLADAKRWFYENSGLKAV